MDQTDILSTALLQTAIFFGFGIVCAEIIGRLGFFRAQSLILKIVLLLILAVVMLTAVAILSETGVYPFSTSPRTAPGNCTAAFLIWLLVRSRKKRSPELEKPSPSTQSEEPMVAKQIKQEKEPEPEGRNSMKHIKLVILLAVVVVVLYYIISPYQNCMRDVKTYGKNPAGFCAQITGW